MPNKMLTILAKSQMTADDVKNVIGMIDIESANSVYQRCAKEFEFRVAQVDGNIYSITRELAPVFGYSNRKVVSTLLRRDGIETFAMTGLHHSDVTVIRRAFQLHKTDTRTQLIDYRGFLTIALEGQGDNCRKVREYLLVMEKKARVDTVIYDGTGLDSATFAEIGENLNDPIIQGAMERVKIAQDMMLVRNQQIGTEKRVSLLESKVAAQLSITDEQEHNLNTKKDELIKLMVMNRQDSRRAYPWFWRTLKRRFLIGVLRGMSQEKYPFAIDWINGLIVEEKAKQAQLEFAQ